MEFFTFIILNNVPLILAVTKNMADIVEILLSHPDIDNLCKEIFFFENFL